MKRSLMQILKKYEKKIWLWLVLLILSTTATAQFTKIYDFPLHNDLKTPSSNLVIDDTVLFGMTQFGGKFDYGAIFKMNLDGSNYAKLFDFNGSLGQSPVGPLILANDTLYGMTSLGGANNLGCIFRICKTGSSYARLFDFSATTGNKPWGGLTWSNGVLYGMTNYGGNYNGGTIFKINCDGKGFTKLLDFDMSGTAWFTHGSLIISDSTLYGSVEAGGIANHGYIFKINLDGSQFKKLYEFDVASGCAYPRSPLALSAGTLYGIAYDETGFDCLFRINTDGTGFSKVLVFNGLNGQIALGGVILYNNFLYGISQTDGTQDKGFVYKIKTDGTNFSKLFEFNGYNGAYPSGALLIKDSVLYGTTSKGGTCDKGSAFKINISGNNFRKILDCGLAANGRDSKVQLAVTDTMLYGTSFWGGLYDSGTIYRLKPDGTQFKKLLDFDGSNGNNPHAPVLAGNKIYGVTQCGGLYHNGCIYSISCDGNNYTKLHDFNGADGSFPMGKPVLIGNTLFGVTYKGGANSYGCIYKINIDGTGFEVIHNFIHTDGYFPSSALIQYNEEILYGTTYYGGYYDYGCLFYINIKTNAFGVALNFNLNNGAKPDGSLTLKDSLLYGTTREGGDNFQGCLYKFNVISRELKILINRNYPIVDPPMPILGDYMYFGYSDYLERFNTDNGEISTQIRLISSTWMGTSPGQLVLYDTILYGMAYGGKDNIGTIFKYAIPPVQASNISVTNITSNSANISWKNGNREKRVVFVYEPPNKSGVPLNNYTYTPSSDWNNKGTEIETTQTYCVYNGGGNNVKLTNLKPESLYVIQVFEYNGMSGNEKYMLTKLTTNPRNFITFAEEPNDKSNDSFTSNIYPNPSNDFICIDGLAESTSIQITDLQGNILIEQETNSNRINIQHLIPGLYILQLNGRHYKFIKQ